MCTANMCRSPMAEGLARRRLSERAPAVTVRSAGIRADGSPITGRAAELLSRRGVDMSAHCSAPLTADAIDRADLVIGMSRRHVREVAMIDPGALARTFTLREVVRRGVEAGPRRPGQPVRDWAAALTTDRPAESFLGASSLDDIRDPFGQGTRAYERVLDDLEGLIDSLVDLVEPVAQEVRS